ncbi:Svx/AvrXca family virulence/avirulence protein [Sphingomonas adhaesiva]|uniref:Svx/AvrXca family virulence/avirulence protein n=1 Tax=Sphingomonas adhaesiva TaxID=28212 RepID=UPI002FF52ACD
MQRMLIGGVGLVGAVGASALTLLSRDAGGGAVRRGDSVQVVPAAAPQVETSGMTSASNDAAAPSCVSGSWVAAPGKLPVARETAHIALRWEGGTVSAAQSDKAAALFEHLYDVYVNQVGFIAPSCQSTTKYKVNVYFYPNIGPTGSLDEHGNPSLFISPAALEDLKTTAHELAHAFQGGSGGLRDSPYIGWFWESHAEFMTAQVPELRSTFTGCSLNSVLYPHFYYGYTPNRYCNWQFIEYLKDRYGYAAVNDLWSKSPRVGTAGYNQVDILSVLMKNMGWTLAQLNTFFGEWAMHNVNWDYTNPDGSDQGAMLRAAYGPNEDNASYKRLRTATLDPINLGARTFSIPERQAPQRLGYNLVRLYPDAGATSITVAFKGVRQTSPATSSFPGLANEPPSVDQPNPGWRWGVVAVGSDGRSRYSAVNASSNGSVSFPVRSGDKSVWLVVVGAPTQLQKFVWDQAYYSLYRYPWMVKLTNAMPSGYQPNAPTPVPGGHKHSNGGGWVAAGANVAASAYVGPYARVLGGTVSGNARIEDHAIVASGTVRDRAVVGALSLIDEDSTIADDAQVRTVFEGIRASNVTGTAKNLGDTNYYGYSMNAGTQYGPYENPSQLTDPARGANRTTAVPEVTAAPAYVW